MLDYLIFIGLWSIVTYLLCRYYYNKGFDEGSKYTSRVIELSSVKNKKNVEEYRVPDKYCEDNEENLCGQWTKIELPDNDPGEHECCSFLSPDWFRPGNTNKWLEGKWLAKKK